MAEFTIPSSEQDSRLDRAIKRQFPHIKQVQIEKSLRSGLMRLDGAKVKANHRCQAGQILKLPDWLLTADTPSQAPVTSQPSAQKQKADRTFFEGLVLEETKDWIALNKPAGLAVQGGTSTTRHIDGVLQSAFSGQTRPKLVHRLDKDTSGLLLVAKHDIAARELAAAFQSHAIRKSYLALILGNIADDGHIRIPLAKSGPMGREKMSPDFEDGQFAHTIFTTCARSAGAMSLVALQPRTGRTHQLRVHMLTQKAPILGDGKYVGAEAHPGHDFAKQLHLHAQFLRLPDGRLLEAPLPAHFTSALRYLEMMSDVPTQMPDFIEEG